MFTALLTGVEQRLCRRDSKFSASPIFPIECCMDRQEGECIELERPADRNCIPQDGGFHDRRSSNEVVAGEPYGSTWRVRPTVVPSQRATIPIRSFACMDDSQFLAGVPDVPEGGSSFESWRANEKSVAFRVPASQPCDLRQSWKSGVEIFAETSPGSQSFSGPARVCRACSRSFTSSWMLLLLLVCWMRRL